MIDQPWIVEAKKHIGLKEVKGAKHNQHIVDFWKAIKRGGIKDDETPWCAAYVGAMLESVGVVSSRFESARSYLEWGVKLNRPCYGCVVVFTRNGGGHVGFVVGKTASGDLLVLGGNQGDAVNIRAFPLSRVNGYRYPAGQMIPNHALEISSASKSTSEA